MQQCWSWSASQRPTFESLLVALGRDVNPGRTLAWDRASCEPAPLHMVLNPLSPPHGTECEGDDEEETHI